MTFIDAVIRAVRSGAGPAAAAGLALAFPAAAAPEIGAPAPAFEAPASNGETVSLADFAGKTVVLEWTNDGCPFVQKHYDSGNMQRLQREAREAGVVWISVISSAPGKQGHADAARAESLTEARGAAPAYILLDDSGAVGRAYEAKTTPQMFIVDAKGALAYDGAIDDRPSADPASLDGASPLFMTALEATLAGSPAPAPRTKPYGCSVKYGS